MNRLFLILALLAATTRVVGAGASCLGDSEIPDRLGTARLVLFGEVHGIAQSPQLVGDYACWLVAKGERVVLALEVPSQEQSSLDLFLASAGAAVDRSRLMSGQFWNRPPEVQDGRSSEAMRLLIERVRQMRGAGKPIAVVAIDDSSASAASRDSLMANNLLAAVRRSSGAHVVALVGNAHAAKAKGASSDANYEPMAYLLSSESPVSLDITYSAGSAWVCGSEPGPCKERALFAAPEWAGRNAKFSLEPPTYAPGFDGTFFIGRATASPPAAVQREHP